MKIAVMNSSFRKNFRSTVKTTAQMGIHGMQINLNGGFDVDKLNERKIQNMMRLLEKNDIEITAYCGDLGGHGFMVEKDNAYKVPKTKRMIDLAKKTGVPVVTTHIGIIPQDKSHPTYRTLKKALTEIGEYAKQNGVTLAIETGPEVAPTLLSFIEDLNGGVGVNLDPANFVMVTGQDPVEAVHLLKDYIVHTHAKDGIRLRECDPQEVYGNIDPNQTHTEPATPVFRETPLGAGGVDWDRYLQALRDIGYNGYLTIERETRTSPKKTIGQACDFLREKLSAFGGGKICVAVVGCGSIANAVHLPAIRKLSAYQLKYCVDIIEERAKKAARKFGESGYTRAITDYHDVLADPEVNAVIVCTHTHLHGTIAIEAMRAGKHVLSEKPAAMNYAEAQEMKRVADETGKVNNIGVCMRFDAAVNAVKKLIDQGALGEVYSVYCSFRDFRNIPSIGGEFTDKSHSGGGVLFDWGVHYLDLILYCLGAPELKTATAEAYSKLGADIGRYHSKGLAYNAAKKLDGVYDVEEYITGFVRTGGASISFNGAWAQNIDKKETFIDFLGTEGGIRLQYFGDFEWFFEENGKFKSAKPKFKTVEIYEAEHRAFVDDIRNHTHSRAAIGNILPTARLLDALYRSAETHQEYNFD